MALSVVVFDVGETLVDEATTHERWEARAPAGDILYVGDRVDDDVAPALAAGLRAVRIRRGAHARAESPAGTVTIDSLAELPEALERV